ncbi:MAG TPA: endopeptidase La [Spirochaetia bacterium]|nr:endopeptidase La [Spirochaetia bacterium]
MSLLGALTGGSQAELPLLYVRDAVVFPKAVCPLSASTKLAVAGVEEAMRGDKRVVVSLLKAALDEKKPEIEVEEVGTLSRVVQHVRLPDGSLRLLVEGEARVRIRKTVFRKDHIAASVEALPRDEAAPGDPGELEASQKLVRRSFLQYAELAKKIPPETLNAADKAPGPHELCDVVAGALLFKAERKQELLAPEGALERLEAVETALQGEIELLNLQRKISAKVKNRIDRNQREYFLQEQLKEINKELGRGDDEPEAKELERALLSKNPPPEVLEKARKELARLGKLQPFSPEAGVLRVYCEWLADLPWSGKSPDNKDISRARRVLDEDHYGMEKPKERILEFIAVRQLSERARGPILCLVGAPGTGKTSLGRSVARALGRSFVRVSLGGVRDEAEIRGHRKTYVGALPGKIIQSIKKAGSTNPVFLLDEIDKMSSDFRGDPASALLEVLDPEQNATFTDHYLELPYDLSNVMFITTANSLHGIPFPLLDRMEVIEVPGYSEYEKLEIAKKFIVPKQIEENGLSGAGLKFRDAAILEIVRHYTMESGVRSLEREIARVVRKLAKEAVEKGCADDPAKLGGWSSLVTEKRVAALLGKRRREGDVVFGDPKPGVAYGLAWTEAGGTLLPVESAVFEGSEGLILTGNLGDVMKESARAALTYLRSRAADYGLSEADFRKKSVHIHVPEGAIPKDGPSAGVTLAASLVSAFTGMPLTPGRAMTGEITLTGRVLPVGGVKEKILAAHRNKIQTVVLPKGNAKDLDELPKEVREELDFVFAETAADLLPALFPAGAFGKKAAAKPRRAAPAKAAREDEKAPAGRKPASKSCSAKGASAKP